MVNANYQRSTPGIWTRMVFRLHVICYGLRLGSRSPGANIAISLACRHNLLRHPRQTMSRFCIAARIMAGPVNRPTSFVLVHRATRHAPVPLSLAFTFRAEREAACSGSSGAGGDVEDCTTVLLLPPWGLYVTKGTWGLSFRVSGTERTTG